MQSPVDINSMIYYLGQFLQKCFLAFKKAVEPFLQIPLFSDFGLMWLGLIDSSIEMFVRNVKKWQ